MPEEPPTSQLACTADLPKWSAAFAKRARKARKKLGIDLDYLADLTCIEKQRLQQLETGAEIFSVSEIQLLGVVLGIGLDEFFPLPKNLSKQYIHDIFTKLKGDNVGLFAATSGEEAQELDVDQEAFEQSIVQLHYCAECLAKFPS